MANLVTRRSVLWLSQTQADEGKRNGGQQGCRGEEGDGMHRTCLREERRRHVTCSAAAPSAEETDSRGEEAT